MPHREIRKNIDELKTELEQTPKETSQFEELLERAKDSIERFTPETLQDLVQELQKEAKEFEVEHPQITSLINQIMMSLSNLGI
jgi:seryl-tRNA synthetase